MYGAHLSQCSLAWKQRPCSRSIWGATLTADSSAKTPGWSMLQRKRASQITPVLPCKPLLTDSPGKLARFAGMCQSTHFLWFIQSCSPQSRDADCRSWGFMLADGSLEHTVHSSPSPSSLQQAGEKSFMGMWYPREGPTEHQMCAQTPCSSDVA